MDVTLTVAIDNSAKAGAWQRRKEQREPEILAAARQLFESQGPEATSVATIARQAGVSEATVFKYFASKQELLERVVLDWIEPAAAQLEVEIQAIAGARARLEHIAYRHLTDMVRSPQLHIILYRDLRWSNYQGSDLRKAVQHWTRIGVRVVERGIADGEIRGDINVTALRDLFYGGLEQAGWRTALSGRSLDVDAEIRAIINIMFAGISAAATAEPTASARRVEVAIATLDRIESLLLGSGAR